MNNVPERVLMTLLQAAIVPLLEIIAGQRPPDQLHKLATPAVQLRVRNQPREPRSLRIISVKGQRAPGVAAIEGLVTVRVNGQRVHAVAFRVANHDGRPVITEVETDLMW